MNFSLHWNRRRAAALLSCLVVAILVASNSGVREIRRANDPINFVLVDPQPGSTDWPGWRGIHRTPTVPDGSPPLRWSISENIGWQAPIPGRGHASPVIWGQSVFVVTADERRQSISLLNLDRDSGNLQWQTEVHRGSLPDRHAKNSHASATPACDGRHVYVTTAVNGSVWVTAIDFSGRIVWQSAAGPFECKWGYASSPTIYKSLVIVAADHASAPLNAGQGSSHLAALHRQTGEIVWRIRRPSGDSFGTPIVATVAGRDQLLIAGKGSVRSYDPATGDPLWTCRWSALRSANSVAFDDEHVFASAKHPQGELICIRADGEGDVTASHVVWRDKSSASEVPSPLVHDGLVYSLGDDGILSCLDSTTGKVMWKRRLGGNMSSSPLIAGGHLYCSNEEGVTFVVRLGGRGEVVAENALSDGQFASPVVSGNRLYLRTLTGLHCIADPSEAAVAERPEEAKQRL